MVQDAVDASNSNHEQTNDPEKALEPASTQSTLSSQVALPNASDARAPTHENTRDFGFIPIPAYLRYNPEKPPHFGLGMNIAFGFFSTFIVSNLYYCQPLLIQLAKAFGVSFSEISRVPSLIQGGYATGLVLISPLGDLVRRRQLILTVVTISTALTIGLAVTSNLQVFEALSYLIGVASVTPQILLPLAADLAPPQRRASAIAVVLTGLVLGILVARVVAGVIAEYQSYRVVYYYALAAQSCVLIGAFCVIPDYPRKNKDLSYFQILWTMGKLAVTEPVLIQGCLLLLLSSACFSSFWVTLTFLLGGEPYHFSTLTIGLFGLVGMFGVAMGPLVGRLVDRLVPWYATLFSICMSILFQSIQVGAGGINIGAVIVAIFGLDVFSQMIQVSVTTAIFAISAEARARLNAVAILSIFIGQVVGTAVGTQVFLHHGWRAGAGLSLGFFGLMLVVLFLRGPHTQQYTWFGFEGGWNWRKSAVGPQEQGNNQIEQVEQSPEWTDLEKKVQAQEAQKHS
ncbi:major facilitator superfamily domain-containing protein [Crepidotus variabilis]|uniref:Major facilitator superfamily domain-containing protein n=1 Tax=Crepidotus variabilis TaxID=179855 RepID=A0A9P6EJA1_9AGAR|nr:major facilitator superfamily domain-containing protein [Crepidotus variabilis]